MALTAGQEAKLVAFADANNAASLTRLQSLVNGLNDAQMNGLIKFVVEQGALRVKERDLEKARVELAALIATKKAATETERTQYLADTAAIEAAQNPAIDAKQAQIATLQVELDALR